MSKKYYISDADRIKLQEETAQRIVKSIKGPIGFYEDWPGTGYKLTLTDNSLKVYRPFCRLVWQDKKRKKKCTDNHLKRAAACIGEQISCCWAGVHNAACEVQDKQQVSVTLMGGVVRIKEREEEALKKLEQLLATFSSEERKKFKEAWYQIPPIEESQFVDTLKALKQAGLHYLQALGLHNNSSHLSTQLTHNVITTLQALVAEVELLKIDLKNSFSIGRRWEERFDSVIETCEKHAAFLKEDLDKEKSKYAYGSISQLIHEAIDLHRPSAQKRQIEFKIELEQVTDKEGKHKVLAIRMNTAAMRQAFHNIIHNAVKYSFSGTVKQSRWIEVTGRLQQRGQVDGYLIVVSNFGIGVEEDEQERVFEELYQGRLRLNEDRMGHGMGLAFVKSVIKEHHGYVTLQSFPKGNAWLTLLEVWLPIQGPT